jgi:hypothetical protein
MTGRIVMCLLLLAMLRLSGLPCGAAYASAMNRPARRFRPFATMS